MCRLTKSGIFFVRALTDAFGLMSMYVNEVKNLFQLVCTALIYSGFLVGNVVVMRAGASSRELVAGMSLRMPVMV